MQCNQSERKENSEESNFPEEEMTQNRIKKKEQHTEDKKWCPGLKILKVNQISLCYLKKKRNVY